MVCRKNTNTKKCSSWKDNLRKLLIFSDYKIGTGVSKNLTQWCVVEHNGGEKKNSVLEREPWVIFVLKTRHRGVQILYNVML
jgi:hypothetical protein